jgi:hypothetical protein
LDGHKSNEAVGIRRLRAYELLLRLQKDKQLFQPRLSTAFAAHHRRCLFGQPEYDEPSLARKVRAPNHFREDSQPSSAAH